ncbi:MAG: hypothetical protein ACMG6S_02470 [Byssovorax sp.]
MSAAAGDDRSRLLRALALSRRFHLFLAYCASPRAADQLLRMLGDELPRLRKRPVQLVRLDPYEGRESDAPLSDRELADRILIPVLAPPEERKGHGVVHVVEASRATHADTDAWGRLFALWNEKRNALQQLGGEVLVVLPEELKRLFATAAPDVWSIRSGEYTIEEETSGLESMGVRGSRPAMRREALDWYRALPPLALFGGDLLVRPWMRDIVFEEDVEDLAAEPTFRGGHDPDGRTLVQRALRSAEYALGQRHFGDAERMLQGVLASTEAHASQENQLRAKAALLIVLAAEDRVEEALILHESIVISTRLPRAWKDRLLKAEAYVNWCAGRFGIAESMDVRRTDTANLVEEEQTQMLQWVERGEIGPAKKWSTILSSEEDPYEALNSRSICADYYFLTGRLQKAAKHLGGAFSDGADHDWRDDEIASALRTDTLTALVELARGNRSRAVHLLSRRHPEIKRTREPEMSARVSAFHAFASGLLQAEGQNPEGAILWFTRARAQIAEWSRTGLDRRSLHRASLAVDLAHATLDPAPTDPVGVARQLVQRAVVLLGDTAEDFIARVLAVEARRELARRLADIRDDEATAEAHRALDLAGPLAGRGVPAWETIFAATGREAFTLPVR